METKVIPVLRIFDLAKMKEFYIDWLGFTIEWEHRFEENFPLYLEVSKGEIVLHLTEHYGECCPGSKVFIQTTGVKEFHKEITAKDYRYSKPGLEQAFWNAPYVEVIDPFGNKLVFTEKGT